MRVVAVFILVLWTTLAWAVEPTLPQATVDVSPIAYTPTRTISPATSADFANYLNGTGFSGPPACGDDVVLTAGVTYTGHFGLRKPTGTCAAAGGASGLPVTAPRTVTPVAATARIPATFYAAVGTSPVTRWVRIRTSDTTLTPGVRVTPADAPKMPKITAPCCLTGAAYAIDIVQADTGYYRFEGIEFTSPQASVYATINFEYNPGRHTPSSHVHHMILDRVYMHADVDYGNNKCVMAHGRHIAVINSYFDYCMQPGNGDAMAIWMSFGSGPYLIHNNTLRAMGEHVMSGASSTSGPAGVDGDPYLIVKDLTITKNYFTSPLIWKKDEPNYLPPFNTAGTGTFSTSGTALTFSTSQSGLTNRWVKAMSGPQAGQYRKVANCAPPPVAPATCGSTTTWTLVSAFSANQSAVTWRWNPSDRVRKNILETKGSQRVLVEGNVFELCWIDGHTVCGIVITPGEGGVISDWTVRYNYFLNTANTFVMISTERDTGLYPNPNPPWPLNRVAFRHNLWEQLATPAMQTISSTFWVNNWWSKILTPSERTSDWIFEYNTIGVGVDSAPGWSGLFQNSPPVADALKVGRFVYRYNLMRYGDPNHVNGAGIRGGPSANTGTLDTFTLNVGGADDRVWTKNVYWSPNATNHISTWTGDDGPAGSTNAANTVMVNGTQAVMGFENFSAGQYALSSNVSAATVNISSDGLTVTRTSGTWGLSVVAGLGFKLDADSNTAIKTIVSVGSSTLVLASAYPGAPVTAQPGKVLSAFKGWVDGTTDPGVDWPTLQSKINGVMVP